MKLKHLPLILLAAGAMCAPLGAQENAPAAPAPAETAPVPRESTPSPRLSAPTAPAPAEEAPAARASTPATSGRLPVTRDSASEDISTARLSPDTRLSPRPPTTLFPPDDKSTGTGQLIGYFVGLMALAGVGLYFMKRGFQIRGLRNSENQLHLLETKMLGNRQFLVVVKYQDNKMLLGVGPGQIQYLCSLDSADADMEELIRETQQHPPGPGLI